MQMQQIHVISNNISVPACGAHEKIEQSAADQKLKGELSASMGSVGKAPVTNTRAERKKEPHSSPAAFPAPVCREPN